MVCSGLMQVGTRGWKRVSRQASGGQATSREEVARGHRGAKEREGSLRGVEWGTWSRERNDDEGDEVETEMAKGGATRKKRARNGAGGRREEEGRKERASQSRHCLRVEP